MFSFAPKQVELTMVPKKGRKNKEIAQEHFENSLVKIEGSIAAIDAAIKLQDPTIIEMRKQMRNALREVKEVRKLLVKFKNLQYKPKRTREAHNTGLEKLRPISESMAVFAERALPDSGDWEYGVTQKSRYDVTNILCAYIKENELRDPDNRTIITPDAKLKKLLQVEDGAVLKYPTMQKYLKNCFEDIVVEEEPQAEKENKKEKTKEKEKEVPKRSRKTVEVKKVEEGAKKAPAKKVLKPKNTVKTNQ